MRMHFLHLIKKVIYGQRRTEITHILDAPNVFLGLLYLTSFPSAFINFGPTPLDIERRV